MKLKHIIAAAFISVGIFSALSGKCQTDSLAWDETTVSILAKTYKIQTDNDIIPLQLIKDYGGKATSYTVRNKKDRHGAYTSYVFYFPLDMRQELDYFIDHIERPKNK